MKKETRLLLNKAGDSLLLAVEHFNRLDSRGRAEAVLILLDHSFEMLLKASLLHRGDAIRRKDEPQTIGFDECVRKALTGRSRFLTDEQALTVQALNGLRDAAQHHLVELSEPLLYIHCQSGATLFGDVLATVFGTDLRSLLPTRALPLSTEPPQDVALLFAEETEAIRKLLQPGQRRRTEAFARLRPLAILDATIQGQKLQPGDAELSRLGRTVVREQAWGADLSWRGCGFSSQPMSPHCTFSCV
jgi:hypothetical protein